MVPRMAPRSRGPSVECQPEIWLPQDQSPSITHPCHTAWLTAHTFIICRETALAGVVGNVCPHGSGGRASQAAVGMLYCPR